MERLAEIMKIEGFDISPKQENLLQEFTKLLLFYNTQFNLTAITDEEEIIHKHFIDSLAGLDYIQKGDKIIDIGSGAGFPSLPLKIFLLNNEFVLLDSLNKRVGFLNETIKALKLSEISAIHSRIEDAAQAKEHREKYDCVLARAVAPLNTLVEYALPFLKVGGRLIAYKGDKVQEELDGAKNALTKLRGRVIENREYKLMGTYTRHLVIVEKTAQTPEIYPRGQNKPKKSPL